MCRKALVYVNFLWFRAGDFNSRPPAGCYESESYKPIKLVIISFANDSNDPITLLNVIKM
jgi:hypothetical protein